MSHRFRRDELYELVWSKPLRSLAATLGISDVALGKACRKADIPLPQRGYWAKKQAGKLFSQKPVLPPRFPGTPNHVNIGGAPRHIWGRELLGEPIPTAPEFSENHEEVHERVAKMLGRISCPALSSTQHSVIAVLLAQDEVRRLEFEKSGFRWGGPIYDSSIQRRRLKVLNAIFLAVSRAGCRPYMSNSQYGRDDPSISIRVGEQSVPLELKVMVHANKRLGENPAKNYLRLVIPGESRSADSGSSWEDTPDAHLEKLIGKIAVEVIVTGEMRYRRSAMHQYQWHVERVAQLKEEILQEKIEAERETRELLERKAKVRVVRLLREAADMQKAEAIRRYVEGIRGRVGEMKVPATSVERWAAWALNEADRIDPVKNMNFMNALDDD